MKQDTKFYELHQPTPDGIDAANGKKWRKEQLRRLWILIGMAFTDETGTGKKWRMLKCYQIYRRRFWDLNACDWICFLAGFSYYQAIGSIKNPRLRADLWQIHNTALKVCESWHKQVI